MKCSMRAPSFMNTSLLAASVALASSGPPDAPAEAPLLPAPEPLALLPLLPLDVPPLPISDGFSDGFSVSLLLSLSLRLLPLDAPPLPVSDGFSEGSSASLLLPLPVVCSSGSGL